VVGALVGAAYAAGELERLETWVRSLTWRSVVGLFDIKLGGGVIAGTKWLTSGAGVARHQRDRRIADPAARAGAAPRDPAKRRTAMILPSLR